MMTPLSELHLLLNVTNASLADEGFDLEQHNMLFDVLMPRAKEPAVYDILERSCMGHVVPSEQIEKVMNNVG